MKKIVLAALAFALSTSAWAFMPASGLWNISAEMNGQPGRGMMIEVQNEVLVLSYFGYRADGSSVKYYAAGPIANNSFTGDMIDFVGGTVIAGPYKPATSNGNIGKVTLSFTSGTHGTITLPGDTPRAITKNSFGYADGPDGLLGFWQMNMWISSGIFTDAKLLDTKIGSSTTTGNGIVTNSASNFACEFQVSGSLSGQVFCTAVPVALYGSVYAFKFQGDRGDGVGYYYTSTTTLSPDYEAHMMRITTRTGARTGLNEATTTSVAAFDAALPISAGAERDAPRSSEDVARDAAVAAWTLELQAKGL